MPTEQGILESPGYAEQLGFPRLVVLKGYGFLATAENDVVAYLSFDEFACRLIILKSGKFMPRLSST